MAWKRSGVRAPYSPPPFALASFDRSVDAGSLVPASPDRAMNPNLVQAKAPHAGTNHPARTGALGTTVGFLLRICSRGKSGTREPRPRHESKSRAGESPARRYEPSGAYRGSGNDRWLSWHEAVGYGCRSGSSIPKGWRSTGRVRPSV